MSDWLFLQILFYLAKSNNSGGVKLKQTTAAGIFSSPFCNATDILWSDKLQARAFVVSNDVGDLINVGDLIRPAAPCTRTN